MSYSIITKFNIISGATTPLLPENYILGLDTNPTTIEEGETATLKFKADGLYFALQKRNGATATGATLVWKYLSSTEAEISLSNVVSDVEITIIAVVVATPQLVSKPFLYRMPVPVDTRLILTKKEMLEANDDYLPATYFALCKDEGHFYLYNKNNEPNEETGKFSLITNAVVESIDGGEIV